MDLDRPVIYRNVDFNSLSALQPALPLDGYVVNEARWSPVDGWGYREKRSLDDGYDFADVFLGMRSINIRGTIYSQTKADLHDRVRIIRALFTPTLAFGDNPNDLGFLPLYFDVPTNDTTNWPSGYIQLACYMRPVDQPGFFFVRDTATGKGDGYSIPYEANLEARDPLFYHPIAKTVDLSSGAESGTMVNRGDYPAHLNFELHLPSSDAAKKVVSFEGAGTNMDVTIPGEAKDRVVRVDAYDKVVTYEANGVQTLRMDLISFEAGKTWPKVPPGSSGYDLTTASGTLGAASQMVWLESFA